MTFPVGVVLDRTIPEIPGIHEDSNVVCVGTLLRLSILLELCDAGEVEV